MKKTLLIIITALFLTQNVYAQLTHYDIDFSSPTHSIGIRPRVGTSTTTVSSINFGNPTVEDSFGSLTNQPLVFNSSSNPNNIFDYEQIELNLNSGYDNYKLAFDMETKNLIGSGYMFSVFFDAPRINKLSFNDNYLINIWPINDPIGIFVDNLLMHVEIEVDLNNNLWTIDTGLCKSFTGNFNSSINDVSDIRFSFGKKYGNNPVNSYASVAIDNIKVTSNPVPEPGVMCLFGLGSIFYGIKRLSIFRAQ